MPGTRHLKSLVAATILSAAAPLCPATTLNLSLQPQHISDNPQRQQDDQLKSGLALALDSQLLKLAVDYKLQAGVNEEGYVTDGSTSQQIGTTAQSALLDRLLGGATRLQTNSSFSAAAEGYNHRINPGFSRPLPLLKFATADFDYQYLLNRASAQAPENQTSSFSFGLHGALSKGQLNWRGAYSTSSTYLGTASPVSSTRSFNFQSDYSIAPQMTLQMTSNIKQQTRFNASQESLFAETRVGAGLIWTPSARCTLGLKIDRLGQSETGEVAMLRSGSLSWFPDPRLAFSLDYGDQLLEGQPGFMINSRLKFNRY